MEKAVNATGDSLRSIGMAGKAQTSPTLRPNSTLSNQSPLPRVLTAALEHHPRYLSIAINDISQRPPEEH